MIIKRGISYLSEDITENGFRNIINSRVEIYEKTEGNYSEVITKLLSLFIQIQPSKMRYAPINVQMKMCHSKSRLCRFLRGEI